MTPRNELNLTLEDHEKAFTETSFLLEIFVHTVADLVGGATVTVGRTAGKHMGRKLPFYLADPTLDDVVGALADHGSPAFEMTHTCDGDSAELTFGRCPLRAVCANRGQKLGTDICKMFHAYFAGMSEEVLGRPVKGRLLSAGDTCKATLQAL